MQQVSVHKVSQAAVEGQFSLFDQQSNQRGGEQFTHRSHEQRLVGMRRDRLPVGGEAFARRQSEVQRVAVGVHQQVGVVNLGVRPAQFVQPGADVAFSLFAVHCISSCADYNRSSPAARSMRQGSLCPE